MHSYVYVLLTGKYEISIKLDVFYRPQRSCGQGNIFTGVCLSTGGEGVCLSACWDARPPGDQADTPWDQADTLPDQADTPRDQADTPLGPGRHPPGTRQTPPSPQDQADTPRDEADTPHPPKTRQTPRDQAYTPPASRLQHTVYERPVRILLECILVCNTFVDPVIWSFLVNGYMRTLIDTWYNIFYKHLKQNISTLQQIEIKNVVFLVKWMSNVGCITLYPDVGTLAW